MLTPTIDPTWAWQTYEPSDHSPWNLRRAGHLYRRATFGANWTELQKAVEQGPEKTIEQLLAGGKNQAEFSQQVAEMAATIGPADESPLRAWWLFRMLLTPHPLEEKLTLFWHNHFATSIAKVKNARLMLAQNELLRKQALGNFGQLLQDISKDPAMLIWLDTNQNKKGTPNENYARELMELFSLGIGNYTEADVREGARAFTGWELKDDQFHFNANQHDGGDKTFLGKSGNWHGEDIVRICLEQEAAPLFIIGKLYRFYVSDGETPNKELLRPLAIQLRESNFDLKEVVATILRSNLFFSDQVYRAKIKSPVEFGVGIVRALEGRVGPQPLAEAMEGLGQRLFAPPSVKGWDGGQAWINSTTLLLRHNLALALTSTQDSHFGRRTDPAEIVRRQEKTSDEQAIDFFTGLFLQTDIPDAAREKLREYAKSAREQTYPKFWSVADRENHRLRAICHLMLTQPEFQLC